MKTNIRVFFSVFFVASMICQNLFFFSCVQSQIYFYSLAFQVRTVNVFIINMKHWFVGVFFNWGNTSHLKMFHSNGDNEALRKYDFSKVLSIMYIFFNNTTHYPCTHMLSRVWKLNMMTKNEISLALLYIMCHESFPY